MKLQIWVLGFLGIILAGCTTYAPGPMPEARGSLAKSFGAEDTYTPPPLAGSLFPSDNAVLGDEAVARVFASQLQLPDKVKVALLRFPGESWNARYYGWHDEAYLKLQQSQMDALSSALLKCGNVSEVCPLPSLMIPKQVSLPTLRESAVRMQADLLLIFRLNSDLYTQCRAFAKDQVKAYSTCELVLLDVRTGLVPFTRVISREQQESKQSSDLDLGETTRRAEEKAAVSALEQASVDLYQYLKNAPKKSQ